MPLVDGAYSSGRDHPAEKLRVLVAAPRAYPDVGGIEIHVHETGRRLVARGAQVTVLTTDRTGQRPGEETVDGIRIVRVRAMPKGRDYYFAPRVYQRVRAGSWDVVHCQGYQTLVSPLAMLAARRSRVPYVVTFHSGGHDSSVRPFIRTLQHRVLRPLLWDAARLICVSDFERARFSGILGLPPERLEVIPNGWDLPDPGPVAPAEGPIIASVGRLERYKGHHRLIRALPHLLTELPGARVLLVGEGSYREHLEDLARRLGVAHAVEFRSVPANERLAMASTMRQAALVVLLSEYESAGIAVLEAAGLGIPALVADGSALHDVVEAGLARGVREDADDAEVARAIVSSLGGVPRPPLSPQTRTWDECADELMSVYESVRAAARPVTRGAVGAADGRPPAPADLRSQSLGGLVITPTSAAEPNAASPTSPPPSGARAASEETTRGSTTC